MTTLPPRIDADAVVAETAIVSGDVTIASGCSIWHGTVIRGDVEPIIIGPDTNVQDLCVLHGTTGMQGARLGARVTVGHRAIVHAATVEDEVIIGMGAIVLDGAVVVSHSIIAAGAVVSPGTQTERGYLYAGVPARKLRPLSGEEIDRITRTAGHYRGLRASLKGKI